MFRVRRILLNRFLLLLVSAMGLSRAVGTGLSEPTNGVALAIGAWRGSSGAVTNEPIRIDDQIVFLPFCSTGKIELNWPPDPAFGAKVDLYDFKGNQVSKTALGRRFGAKYDSLTEITNARTVSIIAWGPYEQNPGLGGAKVLPKPGELFKMETPGIYTLEIEMQMFQVIKSTNQWERRLVRFAPVRIKVEKLPND